MGGWVCGSLRRGGGSLGDLGNLHDGGVMVS